MTASKGKIQDQIVNPDARWYDKVELLLPRIKIIFGPENRSVVVRVQAWMKAN
jgi:hypothetical protein